MHLIDSIGPILGIVAFLGLSLFAFLLFQQGRDIRRIREWAGRAPERAKEAADASLAAAEARGDAVSTEPRAGLGSRLAAGWGRVAAALRPHTESLDRRLPVAPLYVAIAAVALAVVVAGALTSGFGLFGGDSPGSRGGATHMPKPQVAVLNGTSVPGLAASIETRVVKAAGYRVGPVTNTGVTVETTTVMFTPGHADQARALATAIRGKLGQTPVAPATSDIHARSGSAPLSLVIGLDDAHF